MEESGLHSRCLEPVGRVQGLSAEETSGTMVMSVVDHQGKERKHATR